MKIDVKDITPNKANNAETINVKEEITCETCQACCCQLEVMILTDTGVPSKFISVDEHGSETMLQLDDGKCAALDRDTNLCTIYENRPWVCRIFEMGSFECIDERAAGLSSNS